MNTCYTRLNHLQITLNFLLFLPTIHYSAHCSYLLPHCSLFPPLFFTLPIVFCPIILYSTHCSLLCLLFFTLSIVLCPIILYSADCSFLIVLYFAYCSLLSPIVLYSNHCSLPVIFCCFGSYFA